MIDLDVGCEVLLRYLDHCGMRILDIPGSSWPNHTDHFLPTLRLSAYYYFEGLDVTRLRRGTRPLVTKLIIQNSSDGKVWDLQGAFLFLLEAVSEEQLLPSKDTNVPLEYADQIRFQELLQEVAG